MRPIGVFDSGVGGLTVVKELIKQLPYEDIIYLGDTARVPYGTKSESTVMRFTTENILFLLHQNVKLIVIACNTSSSVAFPAVIKHFKTPIIGVIEPAVKEAVYATRNNRIGVIGTQATIRSQAYERALKALNPSIKVFSRACPLFVPLVEEGRLNGNIAAAVVADYLKSIKKAKIDTLILGCTHYPLLRPLIKDFMGKDVVLIDSAIQLSRQIKDMLKSEGLLNAGRNPRLAKQTFYLTDDPQGFEKIAKRFMGRRLKDVRRVQ